MKREFIYFYFYLFIFISIYFLNLIINPPLFPSIFFDYFLVTFCVKNYPCLTFSQICSNIEHPFGAKTFHHIFQPFLLTPTVPFTEGHLLQPAEDTFDKAWQARLQALKDQPLPDPLPKPSAEHEAHSAPCPSQRSYPELELQSHANPQI